MLGIDFDQKAYIVTHIEELDVSDDYVYDLDTEDGTFAASSTPDNLDILCKNTDSCYVRFDIPKSKYITDGVFNEYEYMKCQFKIAQECANRISREFKHPIKLEFEKIMYPFFLYKKKRYAYREWTKPEKYNDIEFKGLSVVRSDFCLYVKNTLEGLFYVLMNETIENGIAFAREKIKNLIIDENVALDLLIISKSLKSKYKLKSRDIKWTNGLCTLHDEEKPKHRICNTCDICNSKEIGVQKYFKTSTSKECKAPKECTQCSESFEELTGPHVRIAARMRLKDPINGPKPPARIPYVYIWVPKYNSLKQHEFTVHPSELDGQQINYLYYFDHQLKESIKQIFSIMIDDPDIVYRDLVNQCILKMDKQNTLNINK